MQKYKQIFVGSVRWTGWISVLLSIIFIGLTFDMLRNGPPFPIYIISTIFSASVFTMIWIVSAKLQKEIRRHEKELDND